MDFTLTRTDYLISGIFGILRSPDNNISYHILEHAYPIVHVGSISATYAPKVPAGIYECIRGLHRLSNGDQFQAFMLTNVPDHTGILIHPGNIEADSSGCLLIGKERQGNTILKSAIAFSEFMTLQDGVDSFILVIG